MSTRGASRSLLGLVRPGVCGKEENESLRHSLSLGPLGGVGVKRWGTAARVCRQRCRTSCSDPSTAALCTRPHSQRPQLRGGGVLRPQSRGPGGPTSVTGWAAGPSPALLLSARAAPLWGCGCHFLPSPVRAPAASRPAAEDALRSCRKQQVFSGSKPVPSRSGPPRFSPCPPYRPHCAGTRSQHPYFRSCRNVTSSQRPAGVVFQL